MRTYHEYQSRTEVLLKWELSRILQFPLSLYKGRTSEFLGAERRASPQNIDGRSSTSSGPSRPEEPPQELTRSGSCRRPGGRAARFMAAIFCSVSTAAGTFPAETL